VPTDIDYALDGMLGANGCRHSSYNRRMRLATRLALTTAAAALLSCVITTSLAADGIDAKVDSPLRNELLNRLAVALETKYVIPETATKLASLVRAKQKANAYKAITSPMGLAQALTDDMFSVAHDKHLRVYVSFSPPPAGPESGPSPEQLAQVRKENGAISRLEILDGNVGYMRVNGVPWIDGARPAIAAAFAFLHNSDALIIDNRTNGGGDPHTAALYVSYLSEGEPFVTGSFHYREGNRVQDFRTTKLGDLSYGASKPVFVLTSSWTFSGGEGVAYDLQAQKRAVIVGETTAGGATSPQRLSLGHQFMLAVPVARGVNPITGTSWEGVGVKPDVPVDAPRALNKAHTLAIEQLRASAPDDWARSNLDSILMKLQTIEEAESGKAVRLRNAAVLGAYVPAIGTGTTVVVLEKDGQLVRHIDGLPDRVLMHLGGNRYGQEGLPSGFTLSFRAGAGKMELLMEEPNRSSVIRVRR
jgi:hypothetical protein